MKKTEKEEELKKGLLALGWRWVYVPGHGNDEPIIEGDFVIGEIEKGNVLVPPDCVWDKPIPYKDYY